VIIDSSRRREQLAAVAQRLPAHVARLSWSKDEIAAERQRALRKRWRSPRPHRPGMPGG
jgi:hypothetical protein